MTVTICLIFNLLSASFLNEPVEQNRPNILFIMTDDQAAWTPGYFGNADAHTPNLDRLRGESALFVNAFTNTPVCSPSRAILMTSRYSSELAIPDWIKPNSDEGLNPELVTWPKLFQQSGYQTALFGKWHLGHRPQFHPTQFGFETFAGFLRGGCKVKNPVLEKDGKDQTFEGFTVDLFTDWAIEYLNDLDDTKPFLISLHYRAPHSPYSPVSEEDWKPHADNDPQIPEYPDLNTKMITKKMKQYNSLVTAVDRNVGKLLSELDRLNLRENTIVIYTSDHGYNMGHHGVESKGNALWRLNTMPKQEWPNITAGRRPNMFDRSLRVPLLIRWPGKLEQNVTFDQTIEFIDFLPSICSMANVAIPKDTIIRGDDFTRLFDDPSIKWDNDMYCEYRMRTGATTEMRCIRTKQYKYMVDFNNPGRFDFFDLSIDPEEKNNLNTSKSEKHLKIIKFLKFDLDMRMASIDDPLCKKRSIND